MITHHHQCWNHSHCLNAWQDLDVDRIAIEKWQRFFSPLQGECKRNVHTRRKSTWRCMTYPSCNARVAHRLMIRTSWGARRLQYKIIFHEDAWEDKDSWSLGNGVSEIAHDFGRTLERCEVKIFVGPGSYIESDVACERRYRRREHLYGNLGDEIQFDWVRIDLTIDCEPQVSNVVCKHVTLWQKANNFRVFDAHHLQILFWESFARPSQTAAFPTARHDGIHEVGLAASTDVERQIL
mmetsp:Transcript_71481/g.131896  ORF Transcript_71481/g.131896 Transcript_71481/m.131896 type:complete len:238 (-) Transcript_71481:249-962(-)